MPQLSKRNWTVVYIIALILSSLIWYTTIVPSKEQKPTGGAIRPACLLDATIEHVTAGLEKGAFTSVDLVKVYTRRIAEVNEALRPVSEINPDALAIAQELDSERARGVRRGPLHGIILLLKDNIASADAMNNTAGSYALLGATVARDAPVAAKLRAAGAILLGKTSLSQWAFFRSTPENTTSGWSAYAGQGFGAYHHKQCPSGSSSGSGIAISVGLALGALGTETAGSIIDPSSVNNIVGIKPTVGLTSRNLVIPISEHQDTVGPMARTVKDAAYILQAIAGIDPHDNYTSAIPNNGVIPDYTAACRDSALSGARIGIARNIIDFYNDSSTPYVVSSFNSALKTLRSAGATVIDNTNFTAADPRFHDWSNLKNFSIVLHADFTVSTKAYLASLSTNPNNVTDVESLRAFTKDHPLEEYPDRDVADFDQSIALGYDNTDYRFWEAYQGNLHLGGEGGILGALDRHNLDAIVLPSGMAWLVPSLVGSPLVTVPLGFMPEEQAVEWDDRKETVVRGPGIPFGISFLGRRWSEEQLIGYAYAFEQRTKVREKRKPLVFPKTELDDITRLRANVVQHDHLVR